MTRTRATMLAIVLCAITSWAAATRAEEAPDERRAGEPSYHANYLVQVTWQPEYHPINEEVLEALLYSSAVQNKPFEEAFGIPYSGGMPEGVDIVADSLLPPEDIVGARVMIIRFLTEIDVDVAEVRPAASEYLHQVCARLGGALIQLGEQSLEPLRVKLEAAREEAERAQARVEELQHKDQALRASAGQQNLNREHLMDHLSHLRGQTRGLRTSLAILNARREAVEKQIAELTAKATEQAQTDPVIEELKRVVEIRRGQLDRVQSLNEQGLAAVDEIAEYKERLAVAGMQLAERRQQLATTMGPDMLAELNRQLYELNLEEAELAAKASIVESELAEAEPLLELASAYGREVGDKLSLAEAEMRRAQRDVIDLERRLRQVTPPTVTIIGDE